ncbi:hypothetical protein OJAV_G00041070 [Oryzias javanicus]|uniref:Uncharacterized protein n=1 Tax=Oryzias javanicus TaxID=123683 RepID=A0A437DD93_ORYJA|nr:hypothetical protein OJAV_G00041070 [Oryzias javanicus]
MTLDFDSLFRSDVSETKFITNSFHFHLRGKEEDRKMWGRKKKTTADDNRAGSPSNTELSEKEGKLILLLKWSDSAKKDPHLLEKSMKASLKKEKDLKWSVVKVLEDDSALIKFQPHTSADIFQQFSGKDLHLPGMQPVTVTSVILDPQTAADAPMTSTPSTSEKKHMSGQSDKDHGPEQVGHRASDFQKGSEENIKANGVDSTEDKNPSDETEEDGKLITLELKWSKLTEQPNKNLEKALMEWLQLKNKVIKCSVVKFQEVNNAVIKVEPSTAAEILQGLSGEVLTLKDDTKVTVESVNQDPSKLKTQTPDDASTSFSPSTSDQSSNSCTQTDAVDQSDTTSFDIQGGTTDCSSNLTTQTEDEASTTSTSNDISDKEEYLITLVLNWSKKPKERRESLEKSLEKSLQSWLDREHKDLKFSLVKISEDNNALIQMNDLPDGKVLRKLINKNLTLEDDTTVAIKSVVLGVLNPQTADDGSTASSSSLSDVHESSNSCISVQARHSDKVPLKPGTYSGTEDKREQKIVKAGEESEADANPGGSLSNAELSRIKDNKTSQRNVVDTSSDTQKGLDIVQKLSGQILTLQDGSTVTIESVVLGSKLNIETADDGSTTSTPSTSDGKGQKNGQSDRASGSEQTSCEDQYKNGVGPTNTL